MSFLRFRDRSAGSEMNMTRTAPLRVLAKLTAALLLAAVFAHAAAAKSGQASREDLSGIFLAAQDLRQPVIVDGIPDFSPAAVEGQKAELRTLRARFDGLDPSGWSRAEKVDYLIVRSELDMLDYGFHVYRATSRNPAFYLSSVSSFGMLSGAVLSGLGRLVQQPPPFSQARAQRILAHMRSIPAILESGEAKPDGADP